MKNKIFWNSFFGFLFFSVSLFIVDRIYMFHQAEENIRHELQNMASAIIASEMSVDVLNNFEVIDDIIRDLLENQRVDRTVRVFNPAGDLLFHNDLAKSIKAAPSTEVWSEVEISSRHLKRLTLTTPNYTLEVGLFIEPMLSQLATHVNQMALILILILAVSLVISFFSASLLMRPLTKLGQFFVNHNNHRLNSQNTEQLAQQDRDFLKLLSKSGDEVSQLANGLLTFLDHIQIDQDKKQKDLYFLAHELKTPLAHIVFGLETLKADLQNTEQTTKLNRLLSICKNLSEFIKDYLRLASVRNQSKESLQISAVKIENLIESLIEKMEPAHKNRIVIVSNHSLTLFAEHFLLESLLQNLIYNALKYSADKVSLEIHKDSINVTDLGVGFNEQALSHMGQPFNRSDLEESTGLGLTYCFEICNLFNWKLEHSRIKGKTIMSLKFDSESLPDQAHNL